MIELIDKERKKGRKDEGARGALRSLTQKAATLIESWCNEFSSYFGYTYYPTPQDINDAEHYSKFLNWDEIVPKVKWFLRNYLRTPQGRVEAARKRVLYAPTLSMFLSSLNDIPLVQRGYTPDGYTVDEDGEIRKC